jgi:hypothetical protein
LKALEKTELEERGAFLDAAWSDDRMLRESVNELLAHHREDSFLEELPAGSALTKLLVLYYLMCGHSNSDCVFDSDHRKWPT